SRGVLHRLLRHRAGIRLHGRTWVSVSGAALLMAKAPARLAIAGTGGREIRLLSAEPRSDRELANGKAIAFPHLSRPLPRADRASPSRAAQAAALSGAGLRG